MAQIKDLGNNKFMVRVFLGRDDQGKTKYHSKVIKGKREATAYGSKMEAKKNEGTIVDSGRIKLKEHMETWLETVVKNRVREKTYLDYKSRVRLYINPTLGHVRIDKLRPEQIQTVYNDMIERNLSPRTVRYTHTILRNSLQQAVKWERIYRNPADLVDLPRQKKKEMQCFTPEQAAIFIDATYDSPFKALFSLLLTSGMRPGEALGLKWNDIDFDGRKVSVNRSLTPTKGGGWILEEPKTSRSRRTIPIPISVIGDLKDHEKSQIRKMVKAKPGKYNDQGFIFAAANGEPMNEINILNRHFKPLLKKANLPNIRLYDLRHTCATLLLSAGENPKIVSERLGHASIVLTLDTYSHVLPDMQQGASDKLEGMLFNATHGQ